METIVVMPENAKQLALVKAVLEEMRIKFRSQKLQEDIFSAELEKRINDARKEKAEGKLRTIDSKDVWKSI